MLEGSRESGLLCELVAPGFENVVEGDSTLPLSKLVKLLDDVEEIWRWSTESAEKVREQAVRMLGQSSVLQKLVSFGEYSILLVIHSRSLDRTQRVSEFMTPKVALSPLAFYHSGLMFSPNHWHFPTGEFCANYTSLLIGRMLFSNFQSP